MFVLTVPSPRLLFLGQSVQNFQILILNGLHLLYEKQ